MGIGARLRDADGEGPGCVADQQLALQFAVRPGHSPLRDLEIVGQLPDRREPSPLLQDAAGNHLRDLRAQLFVWWNRRCGLDVDDHPNWPSSRRRRVRQLRGWPSTTQLAIDIAAAKSARTAAQSLDSFLNDSAPWICESSKAMSRSSRATPAPANAWSDDERNPSSTATRSAEVPACGRRITPRIVCPTEIANKTPTTQAPTSVGTGASPALGGGEIPA